MELKEKLNYRNALFNEAYGILKFDKIWNYHLFLKIHVPLQTG